MASFGGLLGCQRDLPYVAQQSETPISGYQLEGYITDALGTPVKGLRIALWYDYYFLDNVAPPPQQFTVDDTTKVALVVVTDLTNNVKRVLYQGRSKLGDLHISWDKTDSLGRPVPSGVYKIIFTEGGVTKSSSTIVVEGAVTAVTDSLGHYVVYSGSFPIGFSPAPLYSSSDGTFLGNYEIATDIRLEFYLDPHRSAYLTMTPDQVTIFNYVL